MLSRDHVQAWLDRYVEAWKSYSPDDIGALFAPEAEYRYYPWDSPVVGRDAIVRSWTQPSGAGSARDEPGTYDARYEPYAIEGDRAVAVGWSRYWADASRSTIRQTFDNCFLLRFNGQGECSSFTEFYMERREN